VAKFKESNIYHDMSTTYQKIIFIVLGMLYVFPVSVNAESVVWSGTLGAKFYSNTSQRGWSLNNPTIKVQYAAYPVNLNTGQIIRCGSTVPVGTNVFFGIAPHRYTDIGWFATGSVYDSPYGSWSTSASPSGSLCRDQNEFYRAYDLLGSGNTASYFADFAVVPPVKSIIGLPADQCWNSGSPNGWASSWTCRAGYAGVLNGFFLFEQTVGRFWGGMRINLKAYKDRCYVNGNGILRRSDGNDSVTIGRTGISCPIYVQGVPPAANPGNPRVTGNTCVTGVATPYTIVATHPGGTTTNTRLRYLIDWDANGSIDQVFPGAGYVAQGVAQTVTRVWGIPGTKTFKVMAQDALGKVSGWTSHTVPNCPPGDPVVTVVGGTSTTTPVVSTTTPTVVTGTTDPVDPATVWSYPPGEGPVGVINATVNPRLTNTTCKLSWTTEHVTECKVYLQNQLVADVLVRGERDVEPGTYTVRCRQLKDNTIIQSLPQSCVWNPGVREI
jgi:hypothetical protein